MFELVVGFIIAAILLISEYLLPSGRIPSETKYLFPFVILNTLFFGDWGTGRDKYKKIRQAELERMKAKDMQ